MNTTETIYQCEQCQRQFKALADGQCELLSRMVFCVPEIFRCGLGDCGDIAQANMEREQNRKQRAAIDRIQRRDRHEGKRECRTAKSEVQSPRPAEQPAARMPYKDAEETEIAVQQPSSSNHHPVSVNVGKLIEHSLSQHDFQASGLADSQNAKLMEFFSLPHNFNNWFKSTFLEELSGATRMNNRAIDLRPEFIKRGHYIDNCMMTDTNTDRKASYYRVCNIENAVSLSAEQKAKLTSVTLDPK